MGYIVQSPEIGRAMLALREFMFEHVYLGEAARQEHSRIERVIRTLFEHYASDPALVPDGGGAPGADHAQRVTDYLAGMTDRYAMQEHARIFSPEAG